MDVLFVGESSAGISREEFIGQIAQDVLNKLPAEFELDKICKNLGVDIGPTTVVLLQELERFNLLIARMRRSLVTLKRVSIRLKVSYCFQRISLDHAKPFERNQEVVITAVCGLYFLGC